MQPEDTKEGSEKGRVAVQSRSLEHDFLNIRLCFQPENFSPKQHDSHYTFGIMIKKIHSVKILL